MIERQRCLHLGMAAVAFVGVLTLSTEAAAFCRTTTMTLPPSYSPTKCYEEGHPLFWKGACVSYSVQQDASKQVSLADARRIIDSAFATWSDATCSGGGAVGIKASNFGDVACSTVQYNQNGPNQNAIIFRDNEWPYNDPNNTLGLTTVTFNADTGEIYDADMEINAVSNKLTISTNVPSNGFDLASVVTHEAGHFLGLAHATDSRATMFASYKPGTSALRDLSTDDIAGLCAIYPSSTERVVDTTVSPTGKLAADPCDQTPRHGFSTGCESNPDKPPEGGCRLASSPSTRTALGWAWIGVAIVAARRWRRTA